MDFVLFRKQLYPGGATIFKPPSVCDDPIETPRSGHSSFQNLLALLPSSISGIGSGSRPALETVAELLQQKQEQKEEVPSATPSSSSTHLLANSRFIESWNFQHAPTQGFKLGVNQFAAMPHDAFLASSLGHMPSKSPHRHRHSAATTVSQMLGQALKKSGGSFLGTFQRRLRDDELPAKVDYRGTGADAAVKDQAFCGEQIWTYLP